MDKQEFDMVALVKSRIENIAYELNQTFDEVLRTFGLERVLFRLSKSRFQHRFVLKGGMLVSHWSGDPHRLSKDLDFLAFAEYNAENLNEIVSEILAIDGFDGLEFDVGSISVTSIMLKEDYIGKRVQTFVKLDGTTVPISIDIGFGDALPFPDFEIEYPSILGFEPAKIRAYSPETVIAEKFHAIVRFGSINTRMKDYYDLWTMLNKSDINSTNLEVTIESTFERRGSEVPNSVPSGLTKRFATRRNKVALWSNFSKGTLLANKSLHEVVDEIWFKLSEAVDFKGERD